MKNINVSFVGADQDWANEATTYWFELSDGSKYGVRESGPWADVVDAEGVELELGAETARLTSLLVPHVTDALRMQAAGI